MRAQPLLILAIATLVIGASRTPVAQQPAVPMPLDGTVVTGALVTAFLTALGFGLAPALQATGQRPSAALGTAPAGSGGTRSESRGRRVLVAVQVALSLGRDRAGFAERQTLPRGGGSGPITAQWSEH